MRQLRDQMSLPSSRLVSATLLDRFNFPHVCDLFKPATLLKAPAEVNPSGLLVGDAAYTLAAQDVSVFFSPTPENDQPTIMGRTTEENIFTLDKFVFPSGVEIHDEWVLVFLSAGDNYRDVYFVRGNPQSANPHPFHLVTQQLVLARKLIAAELPVGVEVRDPLGLVAGA